MGVLVTQIALTVCAFLALALALVPMVANGSVINISGRASFEASVFRMTTSNVKYIWTGYSRIAVTSSTSQSTSSIGGSLSHVFRAMQAFSILTVLTLGVALIFHALLFIRKFPAMLARCVRVLHFVAAFFLVLYGVLIVLAMFVVDEGESAADLGGWSYALWLVIGAFLLELVVGGLFGKTGWNNAHREVNGEAVGAIDTTELAHCV